MILDIITNLFLNELFVILINALAIFLALLVFQNNPKGKINRIYLIMTLLMICWIVFAYIPRVIGQENYNLSLYLLRIAWFATPLFFTFLYVLSLYLIGKEKRYKKLTIIVFLCGTILSFSAGFGNMVIVGFEFVEFGLIRIIYGPFMWPFLLGISFLIFATLTPLIKEKTIIMKDKKIQYFLIGLFIFYIFNITFNIIFPIFLDISRFYFLGDYSTLILLGFTAYAIVKHQLFDIKVVLTLIFVGLIAILLIINFFVFIPPYWYLQILGGFTIVIFLIFGYYLIKSVIQEIKRREELEKLSIELATSNIKLEAAYKQLEKIDKTKSEFISIASHQLRTPLIAIKGYISMIIDGTYGKLSEKIKRPMENIYLSNERLIKLVNDLLNLSRLEAGRIKFDPKPCFLEKIINEMADELKINAQKKNLGLKLKLSKNLSKIMIDENKLRQALLNILDNAIKYTNEGEIVIKLEKIEDYQQIKISDTGEGMTKDEIENLFQKFSRTSTGNQLNVEGVGIGLYIAKKFIKMHQGKIWVKSPGKSKGSTFYIKLPIKTLTNNE